MKRGNGRVTKTNSRIFNSKTRTGGLSGDLIELGSGTNINADLGNHFRRDNVTGNITFTVEKVPTEVYDIFVYFEYESGNVTWWANINGTEGYSPSYVANCFYGTQFRTLDSGATWSVVNEFNYVNTIPLWDISTASFVQSVVITGATNPSAPFGFAMKEDGLRMLVENNFDNIIEQNNLTVAWVASTGNIARANTFNANAAASLSAGTLNSITARDDGTKFWMLDASGGQTVYQFSMSSGWDLSGASYDSVTGNLNGTNNAFIEMSNDGTKLFSLDTLNNLVLQHTLSTPYDISTISYDSKSFDYSTQATDVSGIFLRADGKQFFIADRNTSGDIYQYDMTTPFDVSTASYASKFANITSPSASTDGFSIKPDGTKLLLISTTTVYEYNF